MGLRCCYYCIVVIVHSKKREALEARRYCAIVCVDDHCHCFTKVTCISVHDLLTICRSIVKIDNKLIMILIGNLLFNKFIHYLFPLMHV